MNMGMHVVIQHCNILETNINYAELRITN